MFTFLDPSALSDEEISNKITELQGRLQQASFAGQFRSGVAGEAAQQLIDIMHMLMEEQQNRFLISQRQMMMDLIPQIYDSENHGKENGPKKPVDNATVVNKSQTNGKKFNMPIIQKKPSA